MPRPQPLTTHSTTHSCGAGKKFFDFIKNIVSPKNNNQEIELNRLPSVPTETPRISETTPRHTSSIRRMYDSFFGRRTPESPLANKGKNRVINNPASEPDPFSLSEPVAGSSHSSSVLTTREPTLIHSRPNQGSEGFTSVEFVFNDPYAEVRNEVRGRLYSSNQFNNTINDSNTYVDWEPIKQELSEHQLKNTLAINDVDNQTVFSYDSDAHVLSDSSVIDRSQTPSLISDNSTDTESVLSNKLDIEDILGNWD